MPVLSSYLVIIIAAFGGWLIALVFLRIMFWPYTTKKISGFTIKGILPKLQPILAKDIAAAIGQKYLSKQVIEEKLSNPELMLQLRPEIEHHVDQFLKEKLPEAFPLLSKFMGGKTLLKFKEAFLSEVEIIFPAMLKSYSQKMIRQYMPAQLIEDELNAISIPAVEEVIYRRAARQIFLFKLIGFLAGGLVGMLQMTVLFYMKGSVS